ncbi:hypothetical protein N7G274_002158 [Stereocaulon virgatum]|uniref:Mtf2-like C-terminal domain-containing protein n=1 Tax=Stereocaulon virgatum TaxID=373712 RepID=A0ABR4AIX7_9LECA
MSLRKILASPSTVQLSTHPIFLLLFLYQTRSTLSQPLKGGYRASPAVQQFSCLHRKQAQNSNTSRSDHVPFGDAALGSSDIPYEDHISQHVAQNTKRTTITASEKAVFDRIFKDITSQTSTQGPEEDNALEDEQEDSDPTEDLNSIIDTAIRELQSQGDQAGKTTKENWHWTSQPYKRAINSSVGSDNDSARTFVRPSIPSIHHGDMSGREILTPEVEKNVRSAAKEHEEKVSSRLERATTDVEIWQILDTDVFSMVKQLNTQIKGDREARRVEKKLCDTEEKAHKAAESGIEVAAARKVILKKREKGAYDPEGSTTLHTNTLFHILQENYAGCLLSALRILRRHHPTTNYAFCILPMIKRLGPISYALGASTNLYNEILFLKWTQYSDLPGMADLLQEMMNRGVEPNRVTMVLLAKIRRRRRLGTLGKLGPVMQKWWELRGTVEGWRRLVELEIMAKRMEADSAERVRLSAGDEKEEKNMVTWRSHGA